MSLNFRLLASCAMLAVVPATQALAADYDPPIFIEQAPEWVPVEIGSGWYLRGDISHAFKRSYKDTAISVDDGLFDNNIVGLGWAGPVDFFSLKEKKSPVSGSVGFGYRFNEFLRADVNIGMLGKETYSGSAHLSAGYIEPFQLINPMNPGLFKVPDYGCLGSRSTTITEVTTTIDENGQPVEGAPVVNSWVDPDWRRDCMVYASAENTAWNGLANGYVDLGTYSGFTPYVGAGFGVLYTSSKISLDANCQDDSFEEVQTQNNVVRTTKVNFDCRGAGGDHQVASYKGTDYNFMYGLSAGVAYQVSDNTKIDVGYQYLSAPDIRYYTIADNGVQARKGLDSHQIKVGLRYEIW